MLPINIIYFNDQYEHYFELMSMTLNNHKFKVDLLVDV
jgi:hypothetical protein